MPSLEPNCRVCYDIKMARVRAARLADICHKVVGSPEFVTRDITGDGINETFCNRAVSVISIAMGCEMIKQTMLANEIYDKIHALWIPATRSEASDHALHGGLAIAAKKGTPHGHVAVVFPAPMMVSPSLAMPVPLVANVGKSNGIGRVTEFFSVKDGLPEFFLWPETTKS